MTLASFLWCSAVAVGLCYTVAFLYQWHRDVCGLLCSCRAKKIKQQNKKAQLIAEAFLRILL